MFHLNLERGAIRISVFDDTFDHVRARDALSQLTYESLQNKDMEKWVAVNDDRGGQFDNFDWAAPNCSIISFQVQSIALNFHWFEVSARFLSMSIDNALATLRNSDA